MVTAAELVRLSPIMKRTSGDKRVRIGLVDGPVFTGHESLARENIQEISKSVGASCTQLHSSACQHGTFIAGMLVARRGTSAPAICPSCTLIIRPVFSETQIGADHLPNTTPRELTNAIGECVTAGAILINLSLGFARISGAEEQGLADVLAEAAKRGVIIVAAAGNQRVVGSSAITRHPGVIPVVACDEVGSPTIDSNLGHSIGSRGFRAPGKNIESLSTTSMPATRSGTSIAVPFVTGALALLWSLFPNADGAQIRSAIRQPSSRQRTSVLPPILDVEASHRVLLEYGINRRAI